MAVTDSPRSPSPPGRPPRAATTADIVLAEAQAGDETDAALDRLIAAEIDAPLGPVARKLAPLLEHQLRRRAREDVALHSPRALAADLEGWTDERLRILFAGMATGTAATLDESVLEIERAHRRRLETSLARLGPEPTPLIAAAREVPLHHLVAFEPIPAGSSRRMLRLRARVPGPLGRRLVRGGAAARLRSALRRQAAQLRAEAARLARDAVADYRRELRAHLEERVEAA